MSHTVVDAFPGHIHLLSPLSDPLYCDEDRIGELENIDTGTVVVGAAEPKHFKTAVESDFSWEDDELQHLLRSEERSSLCQLEAFSSDPRMHLVRTDAIRLILSAHGSYGLTGWATVLAVNYYDRFMPSRVCDEEPGWMNDLVAVACISLAVKVDGSDFACTIPTSRLSSAYTFETNMINRMALRVLDTLKWRMMPVTAVSFYDHIARRFDCLWSIKEVFVSTSLAVGLSVISDKRLLHYPISLVAAGSMVCAIREIRGDVIGFSNKLISVLRYSEEDFNVCHHEIIAAMGYPVLDSLCKRELAIVIDTAATEQNECIHANGTAAAGCEVDFVADASTMTS